MKMEEESKMSDGCELELDVSAFDSREGNKDSAESRKVRCFKRA